jgi:GxxExxY protein
VKNLIKLHKKCFIGSCRDTPHIWGHYSPKCVFCTHAWKNHGDSQRAQKIIGCLYNVSNTLGGGFLEKIYQNAAVIEIAKTGLLVRQQYPIQVRYDGVIVGEYFADLLVQDLALVELKAVRLLDEVHAAQCLNYLRATGLAVCLLVNFYRPKLEIRRIIPHASWKASRL